MVLENQSDDTNPMLGRWLGVSYKVGRALCYWIISEKGNVLSQTTVQKVTAEGPRDHDIQYWIRDYHGSLEDVIGSKDFGTSLDVYYSFVNDDEESIDNGDPNKEVYQRPPDSPEID